MSQRKLPLPKGYIVVKEGVHGYAVYADHTTEEFPHEALTALEALLVPTTLFLYRTTPYRPTRYDAVMTFARMRSGVGKAGEE